jgi:hypothetical protein
VAEKLFDELAVLVEKSRIGPPDHGAQRELEHESQHGQVYPRHAFSIGAAARK